MAVLEHGRLQLTQYDVRLLTYQIPDKLRIDAAGATALWHTLAATGRQLRPPDLLHPAKADIESISKLFQRPLTSRIRPKHLFAKIVSICSRHKDTLHKITSTGKYQRLYLSEKCSRWRASQWTYFEM